MKRMTHNDVIDIIDNAGKETAEKWISNHPEIEAANKLARIEKAAPDLLENLKQTVSSLEYWFPRYGDPEGANSQMMKNARAAIAAAEGY